MGEETSPAKFTHPSSVFRSGFIGLSIMREIFIVIFLSRVFTILKCWICISVFI